MAENLQTVEFLAKLLEVSERHIQKLAAQGYIPRAAHGKYDLVAAIRGYVKYLKDTGARSGDDASADAFSKHRARLTKERADVAERERKRLDGELVPVEQIQGAWAAIVTTIRTRLLNVPTRAAPRLLGLKNVADTQDIVRAEIFEASRNSPAAKSSRLRL